RTPSASAPSATPSNTSTSAAASSPSRFGQRSPVEIVDRADRFADQLGLPIRDRRLLAQALTHTSWLHEHPTEAAGHNERLEFLGDAVINLAVSEALYARHPDDDEGVLSARRAAIVSATGLATLAARIDL